MIAEEKNADAYREMTIAPVARFGIRGRMLGE
jgi:hypothetical protein